MTGMERKGNDEETENSKWIQHGAQFQDDGATSQMCVPLRFRAKDGSWLRSTPRYVYN